MHKNHRLDFNLLSFDKIVVERQDKYTRTETIQFFGEKFNVCLVEKHIGY